MSALGDSPWGDSPWGDGGGEGGTSPFNLFVGGVNYSSLWLSNSLRIVQPLNNRHTAAVSLYDPLATVHISVGSPVEIWWDGILRFAGTVDDVTEDQRPGMIGVFHMLSCVDWNQLCDRELVALEYTSQTLKQIVQDLVTQYLADDGVTLDAAMVDGPTFDFEQFNYVTVADAFNRLSEKSGYMWRIDYLKVLRVFERATYTAPWAVDSAAPTYMRATVRKSRQQYRNRQYVRAGQDLTDAFTESQKGDGKKRVWVMPLPVGTEPTVTVDTGGGPVAKTVGIRQVETGFDFYWNKNSNEITQDTGGTLLTATDIIAVTMRGLFPILVQAQRATEIASRAAVEGGSGLYEAIQDERDMDRAAQAEDLAAGLLARYGQIPIQIKLNTDLDGLLPGHLVTVTLASHAIAGALYLADQVEIQDIDGKWLTFAAQLLSGDHLGGWIEYFRALADAKREKAPRENELLMLVRDAEETLTLTETPTAVAGTESGAAWLWGTAQFGYSQIAA